ncbi:hypothetical protein R1flu_005566 [Riccia fluitans]|uniref:Uncharacterized protein n=1 Tax=Riccia fluitans TaxID=41844 RepID=A0ABD1YXI8_9MARC
MNHVIKIKFEDTLRRLTYPGSGLDEVGAKLTFEKLEGKIRNLFKIPASTRIRVTYTDRDNDVITMGDDQDLEDACVLQGLNPLRLYVTVVEGKKAETAKVQNEQGSSTPAKDVVSNLKGALKGLPADVVKPVIDQAQQLLNGPTASPRQLTELIDTVVLAVTSHIDSAVKKSHVASPTLTREASVSKSEPKVPTLTQPTVVSPVQRSSLNQNAPVSPGVYFGLSGAGPVKQLDEVPVPAPVKHQHVVNSGAAQLLAPAQRDISDNEAAELGNACRVFHSGVQCDLCGMNPIVGPRFKSNKKHDFDLCHVCYKSFGNESDYQRIDRPLFRPRHMRCPALNPNLHAPRGPLFTARGRPEHLRIHAGGKLDARFVQDVTIFDGTELSPLAKFTKIWRLRNSGTLSWPLDTKLVHVGGDELGNVDQVPVELPERGLLPGDEVDVSVDLVAPEKPGRYVSHWRLASPAGPKFGHRVWVLIQVVSNEKFEDGVSHEISPPLPEETMVQVVPEERCEDGLIHEMSSPLPFDSVYKEEVITTGPMKSKVGADEPGKGTQGLPSEHALFLADFYPRGFTSIPSNPNVSEKEGQAENQSEQTAKDTVYVEPHIEHERLIDLTVSRDKDVPVQEDEHSEYINADFSPEEEKLVSSSSSGTAVSTVSVEKEPELRSGSRSSFNADTPADSLIREEEKDLGSQGAVAEKDLVVLSLCEKLEGMGFSDRKLNVQLLEKNNMDLRRTLDEYLYAAAEWDPILEELEEMGFYDVEMNRRLMFKNNGSVKRVVKELVQMYKEPASGAQDKGKGKMPA